MAWNQPIEAVAPSVRQYPRTPAAGSTVTTELATINDGNPCGDRGLDAVCPSVAIDGTDGKGGGGGNRMSSLILISRNLYWIYTKTQLPRQRMGSAQLAPHVTI